MDTGAQSELAFNGAVAPLLIGVTGHRDLRSDDRPNLRVAVKGVLESFQKRYRNTPIVVLSALAEGADRLVAKVAEDLQIQIVAVLPMCAALYEDDFTAPGSVAEFRKHLAAARLTVQMPLLAPKSEISLEGDARNAQYEAAGKYIVGQCQILLALWDGESHGRKGGTSQIVGVQLNGLPATDGRLDPPEIFPVYHIPTPRMQNPVLKFEAFRLRILYGLKDADAHQEAEEYYDRLFRNLDEYNRDALRGGVVLRSEAKKSKRFIIEPAGEAALHEPARINLDRYGIADALAVRFQRRTIRTQRELHWIAFAAFLCFVLFAHWPGEWHCRMVRSVLLVASLVLLGAGLGIYWRARKRRVESKHLDYRALAEGLRVKFFWQFAGIREQIANSYLGKQRTELDWIRNGFRGWDLASAASPDLTKDSVHFLKASWAEAQFKYFKGKAEKNEHEAEWFHRASSLFGVLAVVWLVPSFASMWWGTELWLDINIILTDLFLAAAALLHHYGNQMAFAQHYKQYSRMRDVFERACGDLGKDLAQDSAIIRKLGCEALAENGDWVLLHRERPLEMPHT